MIDAKVRIFEIRAGWAGCKNRSRLD